MSSVMPPPLEAAEIFEQHRAKLFGLAYRLLGRVGEAEEVVQDAFLRWHRSARELVREPEAFLMTTVTRLALDRLKSARARREDYVGPWLPEPVTADAAAQGPLDALEQRDLLSIGFLRLLERLSAPERAVFVLREAFELTYDEIAGILSLEAAHCRQLYVRAQKHLATGRTRFTANREQHQRLVAEFLSALRIGDVSKLQSLLSDDVVYYGDGGGRVRTARKPVQGAERVARFYAGIARKFACGFVSARLVSVNESPGIAYHSGGGYLHVVAFEIEDGLIRNLYDVANPDKLVQAAQWLSSSLERSS